MLPDRLGLILILLGSCSPDPTTNSEATNLNFHEFLDQFKQVLQVLVVVSIIIFFVTNSNWFRNCLLHSVGKIYDLCKNFPTYLHFFIIQHT